MSEVLITEAEAINLREEARKRVAAGNLEGVRDFYVSAAEIFSMLGNTEERDVTLKELAEVITNNFIFRTNPVSQDG